MSGLRLAAFLAAGVGLLGIPPVAEATLEVTPGPFETGNSGTVDIDFDGDSNPEFVIEHSSIMVPPFPPLLIEDTLWLDKAAGASDQAYVVAHGDPAALQHPFTVSGGANFRDSFLWGNTFLAHVNTTDGVPLFVTGNFPVPTTAFLGVRFNLGAGTRYGWIEVETYANHRGRVLQHGYDNQGNLVDIPTPEPDSLLLVASGVAVLLGLRRWRCYCPGDIRPPKVTPNS